MKYKFIFQLNAILSLFFLILFEKVKTVQENDFSKYFFTMYIQKNTTVPYILHANTHNSEHLTIDLSKDDISDMITKEQTSDYTNANFSSTFYYEDEYLVKTCFGSNKIVEIIPQKESESQTFIHKTENNINISDNFVYCYSSTISNPDKTIPDTKAIITYWVEYTSQKVYNHKCILFYPSSKKFSQSYNLLSSSSFDISVKYPLHCTTFREKDIFCSYYDPELNNQFVIETNYIVSSQPSVFFVLSDFGQIKGTNMKPISLNREEKSIFGGYYDIFLSEFHNNNERERNSTVLLYSLYRKSLHVSLVPMFANLQLFFGTNIRDAYIEINLFNYLIDEKELILFFIYNKELRVHRIDYSVENNLFKRFDEIQNLGNFSVKLDNCEVPKYMQTTYFNNLIKYNSTEKAIVEANPAHYKYEQDIAVLLSCSNKNFNMNEEISYRPTVIELPQCLNYLDSIHGTAYHKINFFKSFDNIIYDIYADPRLKSFRKVGIMFYPIEQTYLGLISYEIKISWIADYIIPLENRVYYDITHIKFIRTIPRYVPTFGKPFYLKYRLFNQNKNGHNIINNLSSNVCFFQIKFFPFDPISPTPLPPEEVCEIPYCDMCDNSNEEEPKCLTCDTEEIEVIVKDLDEESETYEQCICDTSKGFYKEPNKTQCICQEFNAYYKSTNLCLPEKKLENGPYYIEEIDDISKIPIYNDCYHTCKKCSKGGDAQNNNCLQCKEGYAYIDDDIGNCYDIDDLKDGYHQVAPDHYVKCHDNCVSCSDKPNLNESKQFCTECKSLVPYFIRDNLEDEYFNCLEKKCDENDPALMFAYSENSHECIKNCDNGVQPYNNPKVCLMQCNNVFPFLELITKKCYSSCDLNTYNSNKIANIDKGTCENNCGLYKIDNMCFECPDKSMYKNKEGTCVPIPKECLVVDSNTGLCKRCNVGYYPLKSDLDKESFHCYESLGDITNKTNSTNFYLNETEGYWDECYEACETCYGYGSENRQRCTKCKSGYHFPYYLDEDNKYNNCFKNLTPNENCTSTQVDIYKYKDYCHLCKEGYSFVYGTEKCRLTEELNKTGFYEKEITIKIGDNRTNETKVKIYYPCYKYCKTCKEKGDYYDHKCTSCLDGYKFEDEKHKKCIYDPNWVPPTEAPVIETEPLYSDEIVDSDENVWFKLGDNSYYMYKYKYCLIIFYEDEIFLINNRIDCINACPNWNRAECGLKNYTRFKNITKEKYEELLERAHVYDEIKDNVNIIKISKNRRYHFHLTNYASPPPKNLSYIHISKYQDLILKKFGRNILLMKVDIKRSDTQSTQVEYQFYDPNNIEEKVNLLSLISKRRLDNNDDLKLDIDLPVDWTDEQIENIQYLDSQNVNAFNSSEDFYTDNCNQFTSSNGNDVFVQERKKNYYPDIPLCEKDCTFVKFNSDTQKVTCNCDYKEGSENYDDVQFANNPIDKKFKKNLFLENFQTMKCIKTIFKWENLKANAGFIIMILFVIIFSISLILYYLSGGASKVRNYIDASTKVGNIKAIIMRTNDKITVKPFKDDVKEQPKNLINTPEEVMDPELEQNGDREKDGHTNKGGIGTNVNDNNSKINNSNVIKFENPNTDKKSNGFIINANDPEDNDKASKNSENIININVKTSDDTDKTKNSNNINTANNSDNDGSNDKNGNGEGSKMDNNNLNNSKNNEKDLISEGPNNNGTNTSSKTNEEQEVGENKKSDKQKSLNKSLISSNNGKEDKKDKEEGKKEQKDKERNNLLNLDDEDGFEFEKINFGGEKNPENGNIENTMKINDNENNNENNNKNEKKSSDLFSKINNEDDEDKVYNIDELQKDNDNTVNNTNNNKAANDPSGNDNNDDNDKAKTNDKNKDKDKDDNDNNISNLQINLITDESQIHEEPKEEKDKKPPKKTDYKRQDSEISDLSKIMKRRNDPDLYAKDKFETESNNSNLNNIEDLISQGSHISNPPKNGNSSNDNDNEKQEEKDIQLQINKNKISEIIRPEGPNSKSGLNERKDYDEDQKKDNKKKNYFNKIFERMNQVDISKIMNFSDDILTLEEFGNKYQTFPSIYIADLKKHHLIYFTFVACDDNNNLFLKLSYFSLSINLYFFLNTCLIFNSNMSDAYYGKSKPEYILMNLLLPFVICGLISFFIKRKIMPQYVLNEITKKIQNNEILRNYFLSKFKKEETEKKEKPKRRKHGIKNQPHGIINYPEEVKKALEELDSQLKSIYSFYWKKVLIYYIAVSIFLAFNWYMMTSFCAIFRNTGVKLILNSFISLFASFILPCILALLPTLLGFLAIKSKKELIYKIYNIINYLL